MLPGTNLLPILNIFENKKVANVNDNKAVSCVASSKCQKINKNS